MQTDEEEHKSHQLQDHQGPSTSRSASEHEDLPKERKPVAETETRPTTCSDVDYMAADERTEGEHSDVEETDVAMDKDMSISRIQPQFAPLALNRESDQGMLEQVSIKKKTVLMYLMCLIQIQEH